MFKDSRFEGKKPRESAEAFWGRKQELVDAFDRKEDAVSVVLASLTAPEEAVVES